MRKIDLNYTFNTRDLGDTITTDGRYIVSNRLIRSGKLNKLSDKDIKTLKDNNLKIVVDFRSQREFENRADIRIDGVTYYNFPAIKNDLNENKDTKSDDSNLLQLVDKKSGGKPLLEKTYVELVTTDEALNAFRNFFDLVSKNKSGAILWHCSQGKDRAGLAAFFLEYALGVSLENCIVDYLETNKAMELKIKQLTPVILEKSNNDYSLLPILRDVFEAKMDYLNLAINSINQNYGSLDNFIKNILNVNVEQLKEKYLYNK